MRQVLCFSLNLLWTMQSSANANTQISQSSMKIVRRSTFVAVHCSPGGTSSLLKKHYYLLLVLSLVILLNCVKIAIVN